MFNRKIIQYVTKSSMNGLCSSIFGSHVSLPEGTYVFIRTLSLNNQDSTMTPWGIWLIFLEFGMATRRIFSPVAMMIFILQGADGPSLMGPKTRRESPFESFGFV